MKKILAVVLIVSALGATSCKKESEVAPSNAKVIKVNGDEDTLDKSNVSTWD